MKRIKLFMLCMILVMLACELSGQAYYATLPYNQNFDGTWVNKNGTRDVPDSCWLTTPASGNNSWRRQNDGASASWTSPTTGNVSPYGGSGGAANFHSYYTAASGTLDLYINLSAGNKELSFEYFNASGTDQLIVKASTDGGSTFPLTLKTLTTAASWTTYVIDLGSLVYPTAVIRFQATGDNSTNDIGLDNVAVRALFDPVFATVPYCQNFDNTWIDRSTYRDAADSSWVVSPSTGNNSWRRQSDGAYADWNSPTTGIVSPTFGTGAANFHSYYSSSVGTMDLYMDLSPSGEKILTFNYYNASGTDKIDIQFSSDYGNTWNTLKTLTTQAALSTGCSSLWLTQSLSLGSTTSDSCIIRFKATGDNSTYDIGIDNVCVSLDQSVSYATLPFTETFENAWTDKYGWKDIPNSYWVNSPAWGNNSWRRQNEGCSADWNSSTTGTVSPDGSSGAANFHSYYTSTSGDLDLYVDMSPAGSKLLTFNYYNASGTDNLKVYLSTDNGSTFSLLQTFAVEAAICGSNWAKRSVLLGSTVSDTCVLRFRGTGDNSTYDIGIDNINISVIPAQQYAALPYTQDFETSWTDKYGQKDVPDAYWKITPAWGNNSWRRQNEGCTASWSSSSSGIVSPTSGTGAADFHSYTASSSSTGTMDLYLDFSTPGSKLLTFLYLNTSGSDQLDIFLSVDGGTTFSSSLSTFSTQSNWLSKSVDLGNSTASNCVVRFKGTSDLGMSDIGIDNVCIKVNPFPVYAELPYSQNFEGSWIDMYGTHDAPDSSWINTPYTGNTSWRRQNDGASASWSSASTGIVSPSGSTGAADFHSYTASNGASGTFDLYVDFTHAGSKKLTFNYQNASGTDKLELKMSTDGGATFGSNLLSLTSPYTWALQTVDLGSSTSSTVVLRFKGTSDLGFNDIGLDNVNICVTPGLITQPSNTIACLGDSAALIVTPSTSGLTFQWKKEGIDITGANDSILIINPVTINDTGTYTCYMENACGNLLSDPVSVTVVTAVSISAQSDNQNLCSGNDIALSISADGYNPSYQWQMNGADINGATTSVLDFNPVTDVDAGIYTCLISNSCSNIISDPIQLTVNTAVLIDDQISDTTLCEGNSVDLYVQASGTAPLIYQWKKDGNFISGATASTYNLNPVALTDAGIYTCELSNACDTILSGNINLIVGTPFTINLGSDPVVCADQIVPLDAGSGFDQYLWSTGEVTQSINVDSAGTGIGTLNVYVDVMHDGCFASDTVKVNFTLCTSVTETTVQSDFYMYPNPTHGFIYLINAENYSNSVIEIFNCLGEKVFQEKLLDKHAQKIDVSLLPDGIYYVKLNIGNKVVSRKLVIN